MHKLMEFILPVVFASAEAMLWVLLIGALVLIGRGKLLPSEKPLNIERTGLYRMRLAPGLNLAQSYIEAVAKQLAPLAAADGLLYCAEVCDKHIATRKQPHYLLRISVVDGLLHFEARQASAVEMQAEAPLSTAAAELHEKVRHALLAAAEGRGIQLRQNLSATPAAPLQTARAA